jgi:hypothetical protein
MAETTIPVERIGAPAVARPRPAWRRVRFRAWMVAAAALVALLAAETAVRMRDAARGYAPNARAAWYWLFEQDPFLGYRGRPHASTWFEPPGQPLLGDRIQHNADGFRDPRSFADLRRLEGRKLVVCVGDADTYGLTAGGEDRTYPAALERALRRVSGDTTWTVFNAGVPGYTSHEVLELVKLKLLKLRPDAIVSMSLRNDFEQVTLYLDDDADYDSYPLRMAGLSNNRLTDVLMRSALVGRLAQRWRRRVPDDLGGRHPRIAYGEATPRGLKLYLDNVALTAALCARSGVSLFYVDQPIHYSACSYGETQIQSVERMRRELRRAAGESGFRVLDAHAGFDWDGVEAHGDLLLGSNESLMGAAGYERLAQVLAPQILEAYARRAPEAPAAAN